MITTVVLILLCALLALVGVFLAGLRVRNVHIWLRPYLAHRRRLRQLARAGFTGPVHVIFAFVDHYEPLAARADEATAIDRVRRWADAYPAFASRHRDADGIPPRHTFFYPEEEYRFELVEPVADLCRAGYGEIEVHLHHDNDTSDGLRRKLDAFVDALNHRHGALPVVDGLPRFAFIHGNWALDNSRPDGRWCGVNDELRVLRDSGCYADFTMPSAPSDTQTSTVNSIYYATDDPRCPKSHDRGVAVQADQPGSGDLMMIQGPLALDWKHRRLVIWPRIENADIAPCDIPIEERVAIWVDQRVHVSGRPEWVFVKVHTHGAIEANADWLFGGELERLHLHLESHYNDGVRHVLHYVSAREMYNIVKAA